MDIAIIGAGIAGLSLAHLIQHKHQVHIFEKSSRPGGRVTDLTVNGVSYDHGAQFFTAKSPQFQHFLNSDINTGLLQHWNARFVEIDGDQINNIHTWQNDYPHYVACPTMGAWSLALASKLNISYDTDVSSCQTQQDKWRINSNSGMIDKSFDWLVTATPIEISKTILPSDCAYSADFAGKTLLPCYSLMLQLSAGIKLDWDAALIRHQDISWISVNSSKPQRDNTMCLLVHSTNLWAKQHYDQDKTMVIEHLMNEVFTVTGLNRSAIQHASLHRWPYANIAKQEGKRSLRDENLKLASIGDWCIKGRVESAFLSADHLSQFFNSMD